MKLWFFMDSYLLPSNFFFGRIVLFRPKQGFSLEQCFHADGFSSFPFTPG